MREIRRELIYTRGRARATWQVTTPCKRFARTRERDFSAQVDRKPLRRDVPERDRRRRRHDPGLRPRSGWPISTNWRPAAPGYESRSRKTLEVSRKRPWPMGLDPIPSGRPLCGNKGRLYWELASITRTTPVCALGARRRRHRRLTGRGSGHRGSATCDSGGRRRHKRKKRPMGSLISYRAAAPVFGGTGIGHRAVGAARRPRTVTGWCI